MKPTYFTLLLHLIFISISFSQTTDSVAIAGRIVGYDAALHNLSVQAFVDDIVMDDQVAYLAPIDDNGQYEIKMMVNNPMIIYFRFGAQSVSIFAKPGDRIQMDFPAFAFLSENGDTLSEDFVVFSGDEVEMNMLISKYISKWHPYRVLYSKELFSIKDKEEFKQFCKKRKVAQVEFLHDFVKEEAVKNLQFMRWAEAEIEFNYCNTLLLPLDYHPKAALFPLEWYDFVDDVPIDNLDLAINSYGTYLNYLWGGYLQKRFRQSEALTSAVKQRKDYIGIMIDSICANSKGLTQEYLLTHYMANISKVTNDTIQQYARQHLPQFFKLVKNERCRAYIKQCYGVSSQPALPTDFLAKLEGSQMPDSVKNILPNIIAKHKGKVIVVDFWATWCGPCMGELQRQYPILVPKFKPEEVAFVFLAGKSPKETWQRTVSELKFEGEHYLLTSDQDALLKNLFQISGIPHHVLISKNGEVVNGNFEVSEATIRSQLAK